MQQLFQRTVKKITINREPYSRQNLYSNIS